MINISVPGEGLKFWAKTCMYTINPTHEESLRGNVQKHVFLKGIADGGQWSKLFWRILERWITYINVLVFRHRYMHYIYIYVYVHARIHIHKHTCLLLESSVTYHYPKSQFVVRCVEAGGQFLSPGALACGVWAGGRLFPESSRLSQVCHGNCWLIRSVLDAAPTRFWNLRFYQWMFNLLSLCFLTLCPQPWLDRFAKNGVFLLQKRSLKRIYPPNLQQSSNINFVASIGGLQATVEMKVNKLTSAGSRGVFQSRRCWFHSQAEKPGLVTFRW